MNTKQKKHLFALFLICGLALPSYGRGPDVQGEYGGVTDVFDFPVGARAMAMGGAYVSVADDPFALYWNPAALERVSQMSLGIYYTNLPGGTQYNYLAYSYPTLYLGTVSVGVLRLSTGDIDIYGSDVPIKLATQDYGRTLFMFGYGFRPLEWFSIGTTLKLERAAFPGYPSPSYASVGTITESAFGADVGFMFMPDFSAPVLQNLEFGINIQNAIQRAVQAVDVRETTPYNLRMGVSKGFEFGSGSNGLKMAFEMDINEKRFAKNSLQRVPPKYHFGVEYDFRHNFMLRAGYDYRMKETGNMGGRLTYGAGISMLGLELDYSYWNGWDSIIGTSHRISFVLNVGKSREQRLAELHEREQRRVEQQIREEARRKREYDINHYYAQAQNAFQAGELNRAYAIVYKALAYDETGEDQDLEEARQLRDRIQKAIEEQEDEEYRRRLEQAENALRATETQRQLDTFHDRALAFFEQEDYRNAIQECDRALALNPNSERIRKLRENAVEELTQKVNNILERADGLERRGQILEAIEAYRAARQLTAGDDLRESFIAGKISNLEGSLRRRDLIRQAALHENNEEWAQAAELYRQALEYDRNNQELNRKYQNANKWAQAKVLPMPPNVREIYKQGYTAFNKGRYDEALRYYDQALQLQPLNETILRAIKVAQEKKQKEQGGSQ